MTRFSGVPDRIRACLRVLGYWTRGKPDVSRFCHERGYRPQYVYEWIKGRVPGPANLHRLARDLDVPVSWLLLGDRDAGAHVEDIERVATAGRPAARLDPLSRKTPPRAPDRAPKLPVAPGADDTSGPAAPPPARSGSRVVDLVLPLTRLRELTEQLVEAEGALRESQERFRIMADTAPAMLWMGGLDAGCTFVNKQWLDFRGRSLDQEIGTGWTAGIHPEDLRRCTETYLTAFQVRLPFTTEYRVRRADGEYRWVLDTGVPRHEPDGTFTGYIGSCIDITARNEAFAESERRRREAEVLAQIVRAVNSSLDLSTVLQQVADAARQICGSDGAEIVLHEADLMPGGEEGRAASRRSAAKPAEPVERSAAEAAEVVEMGVPIRTGTRVEGILHVTNRTSRAFTRRDEENLVRLAEHAAIAIGNARLHAAARERLAETETLLAVARAVGSPLDPTEAMRRVARETARALGADTVGAYLADRDGCLRAIAGYHVPPALLDALRRMPLPLGEHPFLEEAWARGLPAVSSDAARDPRIGASLRDLAPCRSLVFFPMVAKDAPIGGLFAIWWTEARQFSFSELRLVEGISHQAALALESARHFGESERRRAMAETLVGLGRLVAGSLDSTVVAERIAAGIRALLRAQCSSVERLDRDHLVVVALVGEPGPGFRLGMTLPRNLGVVGLAIEKGRAVASDDVLADPRTSLTPEARALLETAVFGSELAVPMVLGGRVIGALAVADRKGRVYTEEEIRLAETFADHAAVALGNAQLFEANRRQSEELSALADLSGVVAAGVELDRLAREVHRHAARLLGAEAVLVARYAEDGRMAQSAWGVADGALEASIPAPDQLLTRAVTGRRTARASHEAEMGASTGQHHWVALPLVIGARVVGGLAVCKAGEPFSGSEEPLLTIVATVVGLALVRS